MDVPPPPPPPFSQPFHLHIHSSSTSFPVITIAIISILATAFLLVAYYTFVIKCCSNWHRIDLINRIINHTPTPDETNPSFNSLDGTDPQKGLGEAIIRAIPVIRFQRSGPREKNREGNASGLKCSEQNSTYECAVCLSEFEDGEKLRVIPHCCHAFHIDCIDIWLQSNANCPLCRLAISPSSVLWNVGRVLKDVEPPTPDNITGDDDDDDDDDDGDYVVIEIEGNNLDQARVVSNEDKTFEKRCKSGKKGLKMGNACSVGDDWVEMKGKYDEFGDVQPIRRSISLDLSIRRELCMKCEQCCRSKHSVRNS